MQQVYEWVKSGLLFGIFSSVIILLCPNKSYEKHINLVVGLLFILVMIHPVMAFLNIDGQTYISYIQNYITAFEGGDELSDSERSLYGESVKLLLESKLVSMGYPVKDISVSVDQKGVVSGVTISFNGEVSGIMKLDDYIKGIFGYEVDITYE